MNISNSNKCARNQLSSLFLAFTYAGIGNPQAKQKIARDMGVPTSMAGVERKIGNVIIKTLFGKK